MKRREPSGRAPDGGWGWVCVFGCFLMHFIQGGLMRSQGVMYTKFRERFDSDAAATAWVGGMAIAVQQLTAMIGSIASERFGARNVVIIGGIIHGAGYTLTSMMPAFHYVFITHSLITALGGGLVYSPSLIIVSQYFDSKRSLALGISTAGSGLGILILAPLVEYAFYEFGYTGGWWIVGAIGLHPCIAGVLYRPLRHRDYKSTDDSSVSDTKMSASQSSLYSLGVAVTDSRTCNCCSGLSNSFKSGPIWKSPFLLYTAATVVGNLAFQMPLMLMVDHMLDQGLPHSVPVLMISVVGITDTLGRVLSGFIFIHLSHRNRRITYAIIFILIGTVNYLYGFISANFTLLVAVSLAYGLAAGVIAAQRLAIASDIVGIEHIASGFGLLQLAMGISLPLASITAGCIKDVTGQYVWSLGFTGSTAFTGAVCVFFGYLLERRQNKETIGQCTDI